MFFSIQELVEQSEQYQTVAELMIATEIELTGRTRKQIVELMDRNLTVMEQSVAEGIAGVTSVTGLTGGDAQRLDHYMEKGDFLCGPLVLRAVRNAVAVDEVNAKMGLICATPTAGSAGVVPGVLMACREALQMTRKDQLDFLFTAGAFGDRKSVV